MEKGKKIGLEFWKFKFIWDKVIRRKTGLEICSRFTDSENDGKKEEEQDPHSLYIDRLS